MFFDYNFNHIQLDHNLIPPDDEFTPCIFTLDSLCLPQLKIPPIRHNPLKNHWDNLFNDIEKIILSCENKLKRNDAHPEVKTLHIFALWINKKLRKHFE